MKHFLFFLLSFICTLYSEGFVSNTQVKTKTGYRSIEYVHQDTVVYSYDFAKKRQQKSKVRQVYRSRVHYYIRLFFDDRIVGVAPDQKLYIANLDKWISAENIVISSFLQELCQKQMGLVHAAYVFEAIDVYIFTLGYPRVYNNISSYFVTIEIGDYAQTMLARADFWTFDSYKRQWQEGIDRIKKEDTSCLVISVQHPAKLPLINWWPMYKKDGKIFIQNHLLSGPYYQNDIEDEIFLPANCYDFIPPYENNVNGEEVSEWVITLDELEDFEII